MTRTTTARRGLAAVLLALLLPACTRDNTITIELGKAPVGNGLTVPIGFHCVSGDAGLLERAIDTTKQVINFSVTVDFVAVEGVPSCRATELVNWCSTHTCQRVAGPQHRECVEFKDIPIPPGMDRREVMAARLAALKGRVLDLVPPEGTVLVRLSAAAQGCNEPYQRDKLLGCAFSCPIVLDSVRGEVLLDLPSLPRMCEPAVWTCASPDFQGN